MTWVWNESKSKKNARLLLLAIADCASDDGSNAYPSNAELQRKTGLSERAVQSTLADLVKLGELKVYRNAGPGGCNRYRVVMTPAGSAPPADLAPPQDLHPPADPAGAEPAPSPQDLHPTPAEPAPVTVLEPSKKISSTKRSSSSRKPKQPKPEPDPDEETEGQRVNRLARLYTDRVKLSNFNAIAGVVRKAVTAGVSDERIAHGLDQLATVQRSVTVDSLRYAIYGVPPSQYQQHQNGTKPSTSDARVADGMALADRLEAEQQQMELNP
jgi:hypothetical protein